MANLLPSMDDLPMSLGDHLHELRRRLIWPLVVLGLSFFVAFGFEARLQQVFIQPLEWAIELNPENAKIVGLHSPIKLQVLEVWEAPMALMMVSFYAAFFVAFPVLVYHLWMFVGVGLVQRERRLAFLFVPAGIMFFYAGVVIGFLYGLPYFYSFMVKWAAYNPIVEFKLQLKSYHSNFVFMTMIFGLVADIPWLIMVLVRVGFVTVDQLIRNWKMAILINTVIAAVVAPPDAISMIGMMIPLFALYALGVGLSKVMMWHHARLDAKEQAAELKRMADEEAAAHHAHMPTDGAPSRDLDVPIRDHDERSADQSPSSVTEPARPADESPVEEPQPVPRSSSITDDLASATESTDAQPPELESSPASPVSDQPPAEPRADDQPTGAAPTDDPDHPRKDDDRG